MLETALAFRSRRYLLGRGFGSFDTMLPRARFWTRHIIRCLAMKLFCVMNLNLVSADKFLSLVKKVFT